MARAKRLGRASNDLPKLPREVEGIVEAALERDVGDLAVGSDQELLRARDPATKDVLLRREADARGEPSAQRGGGDPEARGEHVDRRHDRRGGVEDTPGTLDQPIGHLAGMSFPRREGDPEDCMHVRRGDDRRGARERGGRAERIEDRLCFPRVWERDERLPGIEQAFAQEPSHVRTVEEHPALLPPPLRPVAMPLSGEYEEERSRTYHRSSALLALEEAPPGEDQRSGEVRDRARPAEVCLGLAAPGQAMNPRALGGGGREEAEQLPVDVE